MKSYVCDCCEKVIEDPYEVKMKEFYYSVDYDHGIVFPAKTKEKRKIHLCEKCFLGLKFIAKKQKEKK